MVECALVLIAASILDFIWGDPAYPLHPVRLMGRMIASLESCLRRIGMSGFAGGVTLVLFVLCFSVGAYTGLRVALHRFHPLLAAGLDIFLAYSCMALRDLLRHAESVADALEQEDLAAARATVQKMVGRDANLLDGPGVGRAAVESAAENFVDGFLSPVVWFVAGGAAAEFSGYSPCWGAVTGILTHRVINTLDSMVGYRTERYRCFGRPAARLDDVLNFLPARFSIPIIAAAAWICGLETQACLRTGLRDRLKHSSPNAAHAESCVAGAINVRLGGPTIYSYGLVEKPWLGNGTADVSHEHIHNCCLLISWSGLITICIALLVLGFLSWTGMAAHTP